MYVKVTWVHGAADGAPVVYLSELGADRSEIRKVEVYRDGRAEWADAAHETDSIGLSEITFPELGEIAAQDEFEAEEISAAEFETAWVQARLGSGGGVDRGEG